MTSKQQTGDKHESIARVIGRFSIYTIILSGLLLALPLFATRWDFSGSTEGSTLEWAQFLVISGTAIMLFIAGVRFKEYRTLFMLLAATAGIASVRELDSALGRLIPVAGWWLPASVLALAMVISAWRNAVSLKRQLPSFLAHRSFGLLLAGFIVAAPFAQLIGHGPFMEAALGADYSRSYKRLIEEVSEMLGYLLILAGAIEWILESRCLSRADK